MGKLDRRGMTFGKAYRIKEWEEGSQAVTPGILWQSDGIVPKMLSDGEEVVSRRNGLLSSIYPCQEFRILTGRGLGSRKPHQ